MRCCVPFCESDADNVSESAGITFYEFPSEEHHRAAWLRALGIQNSPLPDSVVCSRHFLNEDICVTECGLRQIRTDAIPSTVQITIQHVKSVCQLKSNIVKTVLEPNHYDVCIMHSDVHTDTEPDTTIESVAVKSEEKHDSMSVDEDRTEQHTVVTIEDNDDADSFNKHSVAFKEEHLSDNSSLSEAIKDHVLIAPSTSKEFRELETTVQIKNEITIGCTTCLEEFTDENMYLRHTLKHLEDDQNLDEYIISDYPVAPHASEERATDTSDELDILCFAPNRIVVEDARNPQDTGPRPEESLPETTGRSELRTNERMDTEREHSQLAKPDDRPQYVCDVCQKIFQRKTSLLTHIRAHTNAEPFPCTASESKFHRNSRSVKHVRTHTGEKRLTCELCDYKCTVNSSLVKHMRTHTGEKPFSCELCDYKCKQNNHLVNHMRTHTGEKPFSCELCDYKCKRNDHLVKHMRTHTGEKPFSCELCDYKCKRNDHLVKHMRTHTGEKPFVCNLCDYKCTVNSSLVLHMRTHTGEKPFVCKLCDYKCKQDSTLVRHMRTHTGEKPFVCKLCDYKCKQDSTLVRHMRTHTGKKPFSCELCDYKCTQNNHLVIHMRTHTGEKPFSCELCDYKSKRNDHLVKHMRTHTGEKPFVSYASTNVQKIVN